MFLTKYKDKNENTFMKNKNEIKCNFRESFYNIFDNRQNSTKNDFTFNKDKLAQSVLAYKENTKKFTSDFGDTKSKQSIKFNSLDNKKNNKNKFVDLLSSNIT